VDVDYVVAVLLRQVVPLVSQDEQAFQGRDAECSAEACGLSPGHQAQGLCALEG
jgi:hypothetical protein